MPSATQRPATTPTTMKAIVQTQYGGPETLSLGEAPVPKPGKNDVLVRVHGASVNAADWMLMRGEPYIARLAFGFRRPKNLVKGRDTSGTIVAIGEAITGFAVGDDVYAEVDGGSFAEYAVAPLKRLALKPKNLSFEQAASVPLSGTTAIQAVRNVGKVKPGDRVLITGASGGVGSFAVQLAAAAGAEVTGVCSAANAELVKSLGAHHVVDYATENAAAPGLGYDVVIDLVGKNSLSEWRAALAPKGTLVLASGAGSRLLGPVGRLLAAVALNPFVSQRLAPLAAAANGNDLDALRTHIEAGTVTPLIESTYSLVDAVDAVSHFGNKRGAGKIAISL
ncbi:MAG: NAD(P)-dependent alcohol dehydrogenase [Microbacteriaceae bacterium]